MVGWSRTSHLRHALPTSLQPSGFPGCNLFVSPLANVVVPQQARIGYVNVGTPRGAAMVGTSLYCQYTLLVGNTAVFTNGLACSSARRSERRCTAHSALWARPLVGESLGQHVAQPVERAAVSHRRGVAVDAEQRGYLGVSRCSMPRGASTSRSRDSSAASTWCTARARSSRRRRALC